MKEQNQRKNSRLIKKKNEIVKTQCFNLKFYIKIAFSVNGEHFKQKPA